MRFIRRFVAAHRLKSDRFSSSSNDFLLRTDFESDFFTLPVAVAIFDWDFCAPPARIDRTKNSSSERFGPVFELDRMLLALLFFAGAPGDFDRDLLCEP